jgi:hypothetical protein
MSGAGAGAVVRFRIAPGSIESGCQGFGRPTRLLVTIGGELGSSVASATNSTAISAKPTNARKVRAGIAAFQHGPSTLRMLCQTDATGRVGPRYNRFSKIRKKETRRRGLNATPAHVCFTPKSGLIRCGNACPLRANSGLTHSASSISLDGCVGTREQRTRHCESQGFSSFEIDHKLIFDWSLDRKLTRLLALKDAIDIGRRKPK